MSTTTIQIAVPSKFIQFQEEWIHSIEVIDAREKTDYSKAAPPGLMILLILPITDSLEYLGLNSTGHSKHAHRFLGDDALHVLGQLISQCTHMNHSFHDMQTEVMKALLEWNVSQEETSD